MPRKTNEWEFQGNLLSWINNELSDHSYSFDSATQEFPNAKGQRSDIVIWLDRANGHAALEIELKTPGTLLSNETLRKDAVGKAQTVGAPYLAIWNMRTAELYKTPPYPRRTVDDDDDLVAVIGQIEEIKRVEDWIDPANQRELKDVARRLVLAAHDLVSRGSYGGTVVDATVFVDVLKTAVGKLRATLYADVGTAMAGRRSTSRKLYEWAKEQGLAYFVSDLQAALAGQIAYRTVGQVLFYYAFRRHEASLPPLRLQVGKSVADQLRVYWDRVRVFDYEALFAESPLDQVPFSAPTEKQIRLLVEDLSHYNWDDVKADVLGSIFEQLLPENERIVLGQYYTPPPLADVLLSMTLTGDNEENILDPAVGSGTFLMRAYDRLRKKRGLLHGDALERLWGVDVSAFAAELAVINLCRQDMLSQVNYPRVIEPFRVTVRDCM